MNMNSKGWGELWDNEPDEDDDFNDIGSDVDANNDETFDNAAEWNEDEHEELIARDSILSHTGRGSSNNNSRISNNNLNNNTSNNHNSNPNSMSNHTPNISNISRSNIVNRAGWSPFGGKDLFTTLDSPTQSHSTGTFNVPMHCSMPHPLILEQQHRQHRQQQQQHQIQLQQMRHHQQQQILLQQQQNILSRQHQLQQMANLKQQQTQQEQRFMFQNLQCFTVEELEKQMIATRSTNSHENSGMKQNKKQPTQGVPSLRPARSNEKHESNNHQSHERRDGEKLERFDVRDNREHRDRRDGRDHREHRDYRDRHHGRRGYTIIPPQVQLSVIDKAKRLHPITAMHTDEFLQDRMPTSKEGFSFKRHSTALSEKVIHDGILTEKERCWLTKIQEKIQADYDDNLDQDYYYLLYFNRSSMTDEAAQKPCGPGVLDRRFIPRERLLYNSST